MARGMVDPNEIRRCSEVLSKHIYDLQRLIDDSNSIISRMKENHVTKSTEALIATFPKRKAELVACIEYFETLRKQLDVECEMNVVYAPPEIFKIDF